MASFLGLGAVDAEEDSDHSIIHQDSDADEEDPIHDDDVDIGFRRHQYETFGDEDARRRGPRKTRKRSKEEAIYGVFLEDGEEEDGGTGRFRRRSRPSSVSEAPGGPPMFVPAKAKEDRPQPPPAKSEAATDNHAMQFVPASNSSSSTTPAEFDPGSADKPEASGAPPRPPAPEETEEERELRKQEKAADDHFRSLLQKAQDKKRRRPPASSSSSYSGGASAGTGSTNPYPSESTTGMPMAFGRSSQRDREHDAAAAAPSKMDSSMAKWEKHNKGIGSKLLLKMGWKGSGGLGSNRRKLRASSTTTNTTDSSSAPSSGHASASGTTNQNQQSSFTPTNESPKAKKGISRPVEVVVRPANMGLGYGSFKEMSQLKSNRKIEAEVRGIELAEDTKRQKKKRNRGVLDFDRDDTDDDDGDDDFGGPSSSSAMASASSAIPSTQELLNHKGWKRRKMKRPAPKVVSFQELVAEHEKHNSGQPVIIDMRGPAAGTGDTKVTEDEGKVPLGEELLHNVTFMLNTHENQLHSQIQLAKATEQKQKGLEIEVSTIKQRQSEVQGRREKLEKVLTVIEKVESLSQNVGPAAAEEATVLGWIQELAASFSAEDRSALKFWEVLAPALMSSVLKRKLEKWDPLGSTGNTKEVLDSIFNLRLQVKSKSQTTHDQEASLALRYSIVQNQLLQRIKEVLESSRWDPCEQTGVVVDMYEYLQQLCLKFQSKKQQSSVPDSRKVPDGSVFPAGISDDENQEINSAGIGLDLISVFRKELVLDTIYPKIQNALSHWKPNLQMRSNGNQVLEQRLDLWILPWIPHLDHPAILPGLLSDCKRKLRSLLSYLQRKLGKLDDLGFVRSCFQTLKPWVKILHAKVIQGLMSEYVIPYIARALAKQRIYQDASMQDWTPLQLTAECHSRNLLTDIEFLSLMEGEMLFNWASKIHSMLFNKEMNVAAAGKCYLQWKLCIFAELSVAEDPTISLEKSFQLLKGDFKICETFYTVLRYIELAQQESRNGASGLDEFTPTKTNYHTILGRRMKQQQVEAEEDLMRMGSRSTSETNARLRLRRKNVIQPKFRDVVEEFATERGILFQPRLGSRALHDGKQVFLFGNVPIYLDGDVVYASNKSTAEWCPLSLEKLVEFSSSS